MAFTWHTSMVWTGDGTGMEYRDGYGTDSNILAGFLLLLLLLLLLRATLALQDGVSICFFVVVVVPDGGMEVKVPDGGCSRYHTTPRAQGGSGEGMGVGGGIYLGSATACQTYLDMLYTYLPHVTYLLYLGGRHGGVEWIHRYLLPSSNSIDLVHCCYLILASPIHALDCVRLPAGKWWPKPATVVWFVLFVICVCV